MYTTLYRINRLLPDSFMGMRYFLCNDIWNISDRCEIIREEEDTTERNSYENPYYIPVIFTGTTNQVENDDDGNKHINNMFTALTGISVLDENDDTNYDGLLAASEFIRSNGVEIISEKGAVIKMKAEGKYLLSTVMYEENWHIWVNGRKTQPQLFMEHFISAPLPDGVCDVTMVYIPRGFVPGVVAMMAGVLVLTAQFAKNKKKTIEGE